MKKSNPLDFITGEKQSKKIEIDVYPDDVQILKDFHAYKERNLGTTVKFAELFRHLVRLLWEDKGFAKERDDDELVATLGARKKKRKKKSKGENLSP